MKRLKWTNFYLFLIICVLPIQLYAASPIVDSLPKNAWISPSSTTEGQNFQLQVQGFNCSMRFSSLSASIEGKKIMLSYKFRDASIPCFKLDGKPFAYGPVFDLPALAAGKYEIYDNRMHDCALDSGCYSLGLQPITPIDTLIVNPKQNAYSITPTNSLPNKSFTLSLLSNQFNCGTSFSHQQVTVNGDQINLSFLPSEQTVIACPLIFNAYGPNFTIPALKAGKYKVSVSKLVPCLVQVPSCKIAIPQEFVDTLSIENPMPRVGWYISPKQAKANQNFTLQLLNNDYGNCNTSFINPSVLIENGTIYTDFTIVNHPEIRCITDIRPFGPSFFMPGLKVGTYPVYSHLPPKCPPGAACLLIYQIPDDTLFVLNTLDVIHVYKKNEKDLQIITQGENLALQFSLVEKCNVTVEIYSLAGSLIKSFAPINLAKGLNHLNLALEQNLLRGNYLLKLNGSGFQPMLKTFKWAK